MPRRIHISLLTILLVFVQIAEAQDIPALLDQIRDGHEHVRTKACVILGGMGPDAKAAIPELIADLHDSSWDGRGHVAYALLHIAPTDPVVIAAITDVLNDPKAGENVRGTVVLFLEVAVPSPTWAVPVFAALLKDKESHFAPTAAHALVYLGPDAVGAVPALIESLRSEDPLLRVNAGRALGSIGPAAKPALPALTAMLGSSDKNDRSIAATALRELGVTDEASIRALVRATEDTEFSIALDAAFALGRAGYADSAKLPAFTPPLTDDGKSVRIAFALGAAGAKEPGGRESVLKLLDEVNNPDERIRTLVSDALKGAGVPAMPTLTEALKSPDRNIRYAAVDILVEIARSRSGKSSPHAPAAIRALVVAMSDVDWEICKQAGVAVDVFHSPDVLPELLKASRDKSWHVREGAVLALSGMYNIPQVRNAALLALTELLKDENRYVRYTATLDLGIFGAAGRDALPILIAALDDRDATKIEYDDPPRPRRPDEQYLIDFLGVYTSATRVSDAAAMTLGSMGPAARDAVPALIEQLKKSTPALLKIHALGDIGPDARAAIPTLVPLLDDSSTSLVACTALAKMGAPGAEALIVALHDKKLRAIAEHELGWSGRAAVPSLVRALSDPDNDVRASAARALGKNGPRAADAVPALRAMIKDTNTIVRDSAADALDMIGPAKSP